MALIITNKSFSQAKLSRVLYALSCLSDFAVTKDGGLYESLGAAVKYPGTKNLSLADDDFVFMKGLEPLAGIQDITWEGSAFCYKTFPIVHFVNDGTKPVSSQTVGKDISNYRKVLKHLRNQPELAEQRKQQIEEAISRATGLIVIASGVAHKLFNSVRPDALFNDDPNVTLEERQTRLKDAQDSAEANHLDTKRKLISMLTESARVGGVDEDDRTKIRRALNTLMQLRNVTVTENPNFPEMKFTYECPRTKVTFGYTGAELYELGIAI